MKQKESNWLIPFEKPNIPRTLLEAGYPPLLAAVLALRGVGTAEEADSVLNGGEDSFYDPMLILDMDRAAARVRRAVEKGEFVAVYGDYDVDGITATCLVTDYLRFKGLSVRPYIPDRNEEGYGVNRGALDTLKGEGVELIITVDCGITAIDETEYAKALGMDIVITDHHECVPDALPDADAVIDCCRETDSYPNPYLAGVGMALKLVCAVEGEQDAMLTRYADLVAVGTVADVMPLVGENRQLVRAGLEKLKNSPRAGFAAIFKESSIDAGKITATTIGFTLAPRLNAAGRLGRADTAARLLLTDSALEAASLASELCALNRERQSIEMKIWDEANARLAGKEPDAPIVLASESWHQGVIGIAASRLAEQYSLPTVMICLNGDVGKGSCRSYGGFNLFEALSACSALLLGFGGHALAAGLNISRDKLDDFAAALAEYYRKNRPETVPEVCCDLLIDDPALLTVENVRSLDLLEPYGSMNPHPVMCISAARLESTAAVGNGKHLKMRVSLKGARFDCIFFSHTASELHIKSGDFIDIAFTPQINEFRGRVSVQLLVSAARVHAPTGLCRAILEKDAAALYAAARYCPERADFVRVWRGFGRDFAVGRDAEEVIGQCPPGMEPERFCLCLSALAEAGLLKSGDGGIYGARTAEIDGKADLEGTELIRALRTM